MTRPAIATNSGVLFYLPLQPGERAYHPASSVQQEQLDSVPVDEHPAEADAQVEVFVYRSQRSRGPEETVGGTEGDPSEVSAGS